MSYKFEKMRVSVSGGVAKVTFDNPPVNMLDAPLILELVHFVRTVRDDANVRVIVFESANPEFFLAHVDLGFMLAPQEFMALAEKVGGDGKLNPMQTLSFAIRSLPQVTIAKLRGRLRGGGNELAMATDMRFAARGETWMSQVETRIGIIPGGGGTQFLTRLVGRARALEAILSGDLYDTATAELYGWINLALPPTELDAKVEAFARRVAALTPQQIAAAKAAVASAQGADDLHGGLVAEGQALVGVYPAPDRFVELVRVALKNGAQTREGELELERSLERARP